MTNVRVRVNDQGSHVWIEGFGKPLQGKVVKGRLEHELLYGFLALRNPAQHRRVTRYWKVTKSRGRNSSGARLVISGGPNGSSAELWFDLGTAPFPRVLYDALCDIFTRRIRPYSSAEARAEADEKVAKVRAEEDKERKRVRDAAYRRIEQARLSQEVRDGEEERNRSGQGDRADDPAGAQPPEQGRDDVAEADAVERRPGRQDQGRRRPVGGR